MTPERWRQIENLYLAVASQDPVLRAGVLDSACGPDAELRQQVESLLRHDAQAKSFLESETVIISRPGRQLGPYRILSPLGFGGMGEVYRAHDSKLGRDVALKTLPAGFARDPARLARFRREARTLASLNHPNIAAIYGLEESEEAICLVLELVEGETLSGPLPFEQALEYARQVAEALEAAHAKRIVHRDLKPANVKVTLQGRVKVLDFGLAKAVWESVDNQELSQQVTATVITVVGQVAGTPPYMSPEQARGGEVNQRTDIWAFGCLLYELLCGKRAFRGDTLPDTIAAVLERAPDWAALPAKTPAKVRELVQRCLEKDVTRRIQDIRDVRIALERAQRKRSRWALVAAAAVVVAALAITAAILLRAPARPPSRDQWVQLTKLPDAVGQPALSPDGKMLAFIRGPSNFLTPGQVYAKILPDGEPAQLTNDTSWKRSPAFSPDGSRIAYTVGGDTWTVPVLGGTPQRWFRYVTGLTWTGPHQLLFTEIKQFPHSGIVTSDESRRDERQIYLPGDERGSASRSYLSPDGKSVLVVEITAGGMWLPCRVVPKDGSSSGRRVGPAGGGCSFAAWSLDGKWMYFTSNAGGRNHIWRQRFPDGKPEEITSGPTEEAGIAMAPDGRSFVTAVGISDRSLWLHDAKGERQISSLQGSAYYPRFTPGGKGLCYVLADAPQGIGGWSEGELWASELASGRSERLFPGFRLVHYDISADGQQVVMEATDGEGRSRIWVAPLDRRSPPREIPNVEGQEPTFAPDGEIFFRRGEGGLSFMYRVRPDGTGMRKAIEPPILTLWRFTPGGRRIVAWARLPGGDAAWQAFPLDGGRPILIANIIGGDWSRGGKSAAYFLGPITQGRSYIVPFPPGEDFPRIPSGGFRSEQQVANMPGAHRIDADWVVPGLSPDVYVYLRGTTQRNLFRIPIP